MTETNSLDKNGGIKMFNAIEWIDNRQEACEWVKGCPIKGVGCLSYGASDTELMSLEEAKTRWKNRLEECADEIQEK